MIIKYMVYATQDHRGNIDSAVCAESSDTIQICGMVNSKGQPVYFESDAYHLQSFCEENGIGYFHAEMSANIFPVFSVPKD